MKSPMEWLKILIFNYPSVKRSNKKLRIPNFTTDGAPLFFFFFFPICKKHQNPFLSLLFSPQLLLFSSMLRYVFFSFLLFSSQLFLINILYKFVFFFLFLASVATILRWHFFSFFFMFFSLYLLFYFIFNCFCSQ